MTLRHAPWMLTLLLLLTGCATPDSDVPSRASDATAPDSPRKPADAKPPAATGAAPTASPSTSPPASPGEAEGPADRKTVTDEVTWSGTLGFSQCIDSNAGYACVLNAPSPTNPTAQGANVLRYVHARTGQDLDHGALRLEWDATTSPGTQRLNASVYLYALCPDACEPVADLGSVEGASPLTIHLLGGVLADGQSLGLRIRPAATVEGAYASQGQDVSLSGSLTFVEP